MIKMHLYKKKIRNRLALLRYSFFCTVNINLKILENEIPPFRAHYQYFKKRCLNHPTTPRPFTSYTNITNSQLIFLFLIHRTFLNKIFFKKTSDLYSSLPYTF